MVNGVGVITRSAVCAWAGWATATSDAAISVARTARAARRRRARLHVAQAQTPGSRTGGGHGRRPRNPRGGGAFRVAPGGDSASRVDRCHGGKPRCRGTLTGSVAARARCRLVLRGAAAKRRPRTRCGPRARYSHARTLARRPSIWHRFHHSADECAAGGIAQPVPSSYQAAPADQRPPARDRPCRRVPPAPVGLLSWSRRRTSRSRTSSRRLV